MRLCFQRALTTSSPILGWRSVVAWLCCIGASLGCGRARDSDASALSSDPVLESVDTSNEPTKEDEGLAPQDMSAGAPEPLECPAGPDGAAVHTQDDVNRLAACETLVALHIEFASDLDLRPLSRLREVEESLYIVPDLETNARQTSLRGLEALRRVGTLTISGVDGGLGALSGLSEVNVLRLSDLGAVSDLSALAGATVTEAVSLDGLLELRSLEGLSVGPELQSLNLIFVPQLETLAGLAGLVHVEDLRIGEAAALRSLALPGSFASVTHIEIFNVPQLATLTELSRVNGLRTLHVANAARLSDLGGHTASAGSLQTLSLSSCPALTTLNPAGGLSAVAHVAITDCDGLTEVDSLGASEALQTLNLEGNASLARLPVFSRVSAPMTHIKIIGNAALVTGPSFPALTMLSDPKAFFWGPDLEFRDNPRLQHLGEFPLLEAVSLLHVENNPALNELVLPNLRSVPYISIKTNAGLTRIQFKLGAGLQYVSILDNPSLSELALGSPTDVLSSLELRGNPALDAADLQPLLDLMGPDTLARLD